MNTHTKNSINLFYLLPKIKKKFITNKTMSKICNSCIYTIIKRKSGKISNEEKQQNKIIKQCRKVDDAIAYFKNTKVWEQDLLE